MCLRTEALELEPQTPIQQAIETGPPVQSQERKSQVPSLMSEQKILPKFVKLLAFLLITSEADQIITVIMGPLWGF